MDNLTFPAIFRSVYASCFKHNPPLSDLRLANRIRLANFSSTATQGIKAFRLSAVEPNRFGTCEELPSPTRQNFSTNRPRLRCLSDGHGLVALGLAARANVGA